jgi:lysophospholipase L1-like esterase
MPPNSTYNYNNFEFSYAYQIDSLGFRNKHLSIQDSRALILFLGDSFTEGVGTSSDSTWPTFLCHILSQQGYKCRDYNAGMHGSDPFYEDYILRNRLAVLHPDAVIQCINYSDLLEFIWRGGKERFLPDGSVRYLKGPWWEPIYHYCHLFRLVLHAALGYDFTLLSKTKFQKEIQSAITENAACISATAKWCMEHHIAYSLVIHPYPQSYARVLNGHDEIEKIAAALPANVECISLFDDFKKHIKAQNVTNYSWPNDGHFNGKGYQLFAKLYSERLVRKQSTIIEACKRKTMHKD